MEDNNSVKSEITVKFVENCFIPTDDESEVSSQESKSPGLIAQTNRSTVKENRREVIKKTLSYNLPRGLTEYLHPYEDVKFTQKGIYYNQQHCIWYYIEHISNRLKQKTKKKHLTRNWKGPTAQCWCDNKLYSPSDECSKCYSDLKLWITLKKYSIDKIAKCYWATSDDEELENYYHKNNYIWSDDESMSNFTCNTFNLIDDSLIEQWESESVSENLLLDFTDEEREGNTIPFPTEDLNNFSWWLELLEKLSKHYYKKFNNFSKLISVTPFGGRLPIQLSTFRGTTQTTNIRTQKKKNFASWSLQPSSQLPENYKIEVRHQNTI
ncbi:21655_t:CDS:1 [Dentiscutata erythropus]|uniref:21655_t:CDS:1 n=1 Tax=Dentiscutata erythropus TaxID=1348616 RepID=A0A9N9FRR1_9GLOM|nr:21655_t:CDS:1 [Dentiscutata erythropus]